MRVAVSSLTYPLPNGVTSSINESVDGLTAAGHEVVIISPDYDYGRVRSEHRPVSSSVFGQALVRFFGKKERMFGLKASREIEEILTDFNPEVYWLHTVTWAENTFEKAMRESSAHKVLTYHTMLDMYGRMYMGVIGEQAMIMRSVELSNAVDHVITPSQFMAGKLSDWGVTKPISVIATGIVAPKKYLTKSELVSKFSLPKDSKTLLYVGRVVKEKNIDALLECLRQVVIKEPKAHLLLVGPGDIDDTIERAKEFGVEKFVTCVGQLPLEQAKACYAAANVFVFASQTETQGLVIGEAMIARTPVVALRSPIQKEVYPENVSIVADSVQELADGVLRVLSGGKSEKDLIERAFKFVSTNFSKEIMIKKQIAVLEQTTVRK